MSPSSTSTSAPFRDLFSTVAARYARFRPRYPTALVDALAAALDVKPAFFFRAPPEDISAANSNFRLLTLRVSA